MKKHVMVIDDEVAIRDLLARYLALAGYRVSGVGSAVEAEKLIVTDPPQVIISDLQLEDSDGLVLIERLKALLPDTPVILLTGVLFDPEVIAGTLSHKISSYLQKTTPLNKIVEEVRRLIG
ncbi:MAG TPA: response regulator [Opitutaceae bacterium]|nr:response regulator [Opitutaceae bacterium]